MLPPPLSLSLSFVVVVGGGGDGRKANFHCMHFIMNNKVLLHFGRSATKRRDKTFAAQIDNGSHVDSFFVVAVGGVCACVRACVRVCVCVFCFDFCFSLWGIYSETCVTGGG